MDGFFEEDGKWREEVGHGEAERTDLETSENAVTPCDWWETEELDNHHYYAIGREDNPNAPRAQAKAAGELKRKMNIRVSVSVLRVEMKEYRNLSESVANFNLMGHDIRADRMQYCVAQVCNKQVDSDLTEARRRL